MVFGSKWQIGHGSSGLLFQYGSTIFWMMVINTSGAQTPPSGVAEVSAAHRALLGHTV
jgi:hypothetical protein